MNSDNIFELHSDMDWAQGAKAGSVGFSLGIYRKMYSLEVYVEMEGMFDFPVSILLYNHSYC